MSISIVEESVMSALSHAVLHDVNGPRPSLTVYPPDSSSSMESPLKGGSDLSRSSSSDERSSGDQTKAITSTVSLSSSVESESYDGGESINNNARRYAAIQWRCE